MVVGGLAADDLLHPTVLAVGMIAAGWATLVALLFGPPASYGRYSTTGWGYLVPAKLAWFVQELPSFAVPALWLTLRATPAELARLSAPPNALLMAAFLAHYFYRDLIFPFRLRGGQPTPISICLLALAFCVYNGYMQTKYLLDEAPLSAALTPRIVIGLATWLTGWAINLHSDNTLLALRKPGDKKGVYRIPRGGLFEYVSAANYSGEILEWAGWAIASGSWPAAAFAFFTFCNLAPRGWRHHQWYRSQFPRYPRQRKAVIPFVW